MPASPSLPPKPHNLAPPANGPALQLIEYSNGQVVWSVVDGLRAGVEDEWDIDDLADDSFSERDPRRTSGMSEVSSTRGMPSRGNGSDDMQLLFKEHKRIASKDSDSSYVSRRKVLPPSRLVSRPETKVFYSSAAEIESLIESISQGMDAGSFNVLPRAQAEPVPSLPPLQVPRRGGTDTSRRVPSTRI